MNRDSQTIQLKDGRVLGYAEYGDLKGKPLMFFHGWPDSRYSFAKIEPIASRLHIRVIAPDRPGYGLSDWQPDRKLLNWPDDVVELADYLKINKIATLGVSGGGPYAAVCAYKIPERLTRVGIVVGLAPTWLPGMFDGVKGIAKFGWENFGRYPLLRKVSTFLHFVNSRVGLSLGLHRFFFGAKIDRKIFASQEMRPMLARSYKEAFRQGYRGPELDLQLYTTNWGFDTRKIQAITYLWYGADDQNVSVNSGKYYAKNIRGSKLTVYPGEGHLVSVTHAEEILKTLTL